MLITRLLLVLEVWDGKPTYRKSWAGNLLAWSDLTLGPFFKVKRAPKLKVLITHLLLILEVYSTKPSHTKSWARNFLMLDLTLGPSFKVKQWFTGFGELSFRWIQICIGLRCVGLVENCYSDLNQKPWIIILSFSKPF